MQTQTMQFNTDLQADFLTNPWQQMALDAERLAKQEQLGFLVNDNSLKLCPFSLSGFEITREQHARLLALSGALAAIVSQVSEDGGFLNGLFDVGSGKAESLQQRLWRAYSRQSRIGIRASGLNVQRSDFQLDSSGVWRLVELNNIAAGMGPFSESLGRIQWQLRPGLLHGLGFNVLLPEPNPAAAKLGMALYDAALAQSMKRDERQPVVGFVVEAGEDNVFDQLKVQEVLTRQGARVIRFTLADLQSGAEADSLGRLWVRAESGQRVCVDLLYFRTGYNVEDYGLDRLSVDGAVEFRAALEGFDVVLCPSIPLQLASSKQVQFSLSGWGLDEYLRAGFSAELAELLCGAVGLRHLPLTLGNVELIGVRGDWRGWVLKRYGEGGGNVVVGDDIPERWRGLRFEEWDQWFLMERIDGVRLDSVLFFRGGALGVLDAAVSEVGVFNVGCEGVYAGYLVRTKPFAAAEAGVHRGEGVLDTLVVGG